MNKMWVWVGFPMGLGVLLLLIVLMSSEAGADTKYKTVKTITGQDAQIAYRDKKPGTGGTVKENDMVKINLAVRIGGKNQPGKLHTYNVGSKDFGPGFDEGLIGMKEKGVREITVPPELMMMPAKDLPPGDIVFDVELIEIMPPMMFPPGHPVPGKNRRDKEEGDDMP